MIRFVGCRLLCMGLLVCSAVLLHSLDANAMPSSKLSREVVERIRPELEAELGKQGLSYGVPIFIRIFKETHELELWVKKGGEFIIFRRYEVCALGDELGPKLKYGDGVTPEGFYYVGRSGLSPRSPYHLGLNIGYPNSFDRSKRRSGGGVMIHGGCESDGSLAMTDSAIEEIYTMAHGALAQGQRYFRVHIFPFRMNAFNRQRRNLSEWARFWDNLQEGYTFFEERRVPPNVVVERGRYTFYEPGEGSE